ncbi:hypothetical protein GCM10009838_10360 [Catenulispora subtropica]|uniref:Penicillin-binding protein transpeptidase domain-containing protein n=2 Tax=Catenulispora subtropica TaxID=450798 RepID=A0ABP5C299_9ACTN
MVVLRADTGEILAMASHGAADLAYHAQLAPGSTFKVVTAEDLLRNGVRASTPAPCKAHDDEYDVSNDDTSLTNGHADLGWAFTYSCNTSFTGLLGRLSGSPLDREASTYFGLNQPWDLGLGPVTYGASGAANVPEATGGDFAREMFGQGEITVSPLNMASVAATVAAGSFHQPILVRGTKASAHAQPLDKTVAATLRTLMRRVVTEGTASSLRRVSPAVSAKTGTAEPGGNAANNSWMIAFQGDIAVACLVEGGGHGDDAAGPAIAAMLGAVR